MKKLSINTAIELHECRRTLALTLDRLDRLGAGLAAIHVNAAIEQLNDNIGVIEHSLVHDFEPSFIRIVQGGRVLN
ncbi:hypothetical protein [Qipengyuania sp. ASV99]|uniref:hypothetical protein n=1 Tax=Qipengyuania sp. ASV99 TaxID=3399681 RepID=UPI003A4C6C54